MKSKKGIYISIKKAQYYIVLISLIPALIIISISENRRARQWESITAQEALNQARSIANLQFSITEATRQMLATLAALPEFQRLDGAAMKPILQNIHAQNNAYLNFTAIDSEGVVVASSRLEAGVNLKGRPHIEAVLHTAGFSPGAYIVGLVENTPSFSFAYPIISAKGDLKGAIAATFKLSSYEAYMKDLSIPRDTILGLVDRYGTRLFYYPPSETNPIGKPIKYEIWDPMQNGSDSDVLLNTGSDGKKRYYAYTKLRIRPDEAPYMYVVYGIPYNIVLDRVLPILYQELALLLFTLGAALLLTRLVYDRLFGRRLSALVDLTQSIGRAPEASQAVQGTTHPAFHTPIPPPAPDPTPDLGVIQRELYTLYKTLQDSYRKQQEYEVHLQKALQEKSMLIKEVHHRVKNDFQLILSMVRLQSESFEDIEGFRESMESRIASMSLVHQMLYETGEQGCIDLGSYGRKIIELVISLKDTLIPITIDVQTEEIPCPLDKAITFGLLLNELVMNSLKHGIASTRDTRFTLDLHKTGDLVSFTFKDNGIGLPENFSPEHSRGLGMQLALGLAEQLGGKLRWDSCGGAAFHVDFPLECGVTNL
ncbi:MAG TPA: histidine kinase dimerization/phosphoacceptor domain -containing protein [Treponema sp.]|nr:histidine kinase dimerization/phosphoacceptor domain -containing protein [Treponema sp.]